MALLLHVVLLSQRQAPFSFPKKNVTYLERERLRLSCLRREGLGEPEELLELELRDELELPERLDADEELEPELDPELDPDDELEEELERELLEQRR